LLTGNMKQKEIFGWRKKLIHDAKKIHSCLDSLSLLFLSMDILMVVFNQRGNLWVAAKYYVPVELLENESKLKNLGIYVYSG